MEPAVGVMVDDVYMSHVGMTYQDFTDMDRVEVMRGPQGTLMGKNTTMGALNYVSKAASFNQQGSVEGEVGGNQQTGVIPGAFKVRSSYTNGVIDDLLAVRASAFIDDQQGDLHNINATGGTINGRNRFGGRLQFLLTPTDKLRFRLMTDFAESNETSNVKPNMIDPTKFANGALRTASNALTYSSRLSRSYFGGYQPIIGGNAWNEMDLGQAKSIPTTNGGVSGKLDWDIGPGTLTSVTAYRQFHLDAMNDTDQTKFDINTGGTLVDTLQYSEELRYAWKPVAWLENQIGTFLMHTQTSSTSRSLYGADAGAFYASNAQYTALANNKGLLNQALNNVYTTNLTTPWTDSVAFFDQGNIHLTDKLTLTLGGRETFEHKGAGNQATLGLFGGGAIAPITSGGTAAEISAANAVRTSQNFVSYGYHNANYVEQWSSSWLASPSYKVNDNLLLYTTASYGQKSASIQFNTQTGASFVVKPEKSLDFELGAKSTLLDKKLMLNLNLYHTTVTDYQATTNVVDPTTATGYRSQLGNIPGIEAMGVELDSAFYPTNYFTFTFGGAFNHAVYSSWHNATCPAEVTGQTNCDNTGKQVVGAPVLTGIFGSDLHKPLGVYGLTGHAWAYTTVRSQQNLDALLSVYGKQPTYQVTDIGVGLFTGGKNKYEVNLVANNVFDTKYTTSVTSMTNQAAVGYDGIGARRYVGLVFNTKF
jgi:iron complex outermembrane recepter protein